MIATVGGRQPSEAKSHVSCRDPAGQRSSPSGIVTKSVKSPTWLDLQELTCKSLIREGLGQLNGLSFHLSQTPACASLRKVRAFLMKNRI